jgi:hypothetical protein
MNRLVRLSAVVTLGVLALAGCPGPSDPPAPPAPPDAPASLTATPFNAAVTLSWTASARAESYKVYQSATSGQPTTAMTLLASGITGTSFNALATNDVLLYYRVTAVNSGGESAGSSEASAMATGTLYPAAPVGLTATPGNQSVTLAWDDVPGAASYVVYRSTSPGVTAATPTFYTTTSSSYVNTGLTNGLTYYYAVAARIAATESALSAEVAATPVVPPPLPYIDATEILMSGAQGYGSYSVQVCTSSSCMTPVTNAIVTIGGTPLSYDAGNEEYAGEPSSSIAGATLALVVTIPAGTPVQAGSYTANATMYTQAPALTSPASGATWLASQSHTLTWTPASPTDGSTYGYMLLNTNTFSWSFGTTATTSATVAANTLSTGPYLGLVEVVRTGQIPIPGAATGSGITVGASSDYVSFTVQ